MPDRLPEFMSKMVSAPTTQDTERREDARTEVLEAQSRGIFATPTVLLDNRGGQPLTDPDNGKQVKTITQDPYDSGSKTIVYADGTVRNLTTAGEWLVWGTNFKAAQNEAASYGASQIGIPNVADQNQARGWQAALAAGIPGATQRQADAAAQATTPVMGRGIDAAVAQRSLADQQFAARLAASRAGALGAFNEQQAGFLGASQARQGDQGLQGLLSDRAMANQAAGTAIATGQRMSADAQANRNTAAVGSAFQAGGEIAKGIFSAMKDDEEDEG